MTYVDIFVHVEVTSKIVSWFTVIIDRNSPVISRSQLADLMVCSKKNTKEEKITIPRKMVNVLILDSFSQRLQ